MELSDYSTVPPGFRFHPTEVELVGYYLKRKIDSLKIDLDVIVDIDLYKMEPWDIQERCKLGYDEQSEWYFFSHKDRKYPTGTKTNRATAAGFWKATGRDKAVVSKNKIIGMRKTLVFYKGRAPNGRKTDWIMHEYRLQTSDHTPPQEEGWVVCRAFRKPIPNQRPGFETWNLHAYYVKQNFSGQYPPAAADHNNTSSHYDHTPNHPFIHYDHPNISSASASENHHPHLMAASATTSTHNCSNNPLLETPPNFIIMDLPQLNSPTPTPDLLTNPSTDQDTITTSDRQENSRHNRSSTTIVDWRNLDSLLSANTSSYEDPFLGCFTADS